MAAIGIPSQICEKWMRNCPLTEQQKKANRAKSTVRARVEHIFGAQTQMGGHIERTIGSLRAWVKIGMMNLVYNMVRLGQLNRRGRRNAPTAALGREKQAGIDQIRDGMRKKCRSEIELDVIAEKLYSLN